MKELEINFTGKGQVRGFKFTQLKRTQNAYLYEVNTGDNTHYEIFERVENTRFGCVSYPSNNSFGKWASTTNSKTKALELLDYYDLKVTLRNQNV